MGTSISTLFEKLLPIEKLCVVIRLVTNLLRVNMLSQFLQVIKELRSEMLSKDNMLNPQVGQG